MKFFTTSLLLLATGASALPGFIGFKARPCSVERAQLPNPPAGFDATFTSPKDQNLELATVVLGTGTQNYTCSSSTAAPVANGAKADLYDVSCLATFFPEFLHHLPGFILNRPKEMELVLKTFSFGKTGIHIFPDATTPVFEFVPEERKKFVGKKKGATPAPVMATHGEFGAVDWLDLEVKEEMLGGYKKAYRVVTAGGKPPATCEGRPEHFEMKYATEYWFYK